MPDQLQLRGGTTVQHSTFTGASKEVTIDTTKKTAVIHDGSTAGGNPLMREDGSNSALALGSAGSPSLKWDANTGLYSPGADQVAISTNGQGRLFIGTTGAVGINNSSPSVLFHVTGTTGYVLAADGTTSGTTLGVFSDASYTKLIAVNNARSSFAPLVLDGSDTRFLVSGTERLRLTSTGTLNFVGAGTAGSTQAVSFNGSAPVNSMVLDSSGRLGVGSSAPQELLNVNGNILVGVDGTATASEKIIRSSNTSTSFGNDSGANLVLQSGAGTGIYGSSIQFRTPQPSGVANTLGTQTTRMTIDTQGRVGIGSTPDSRLHVSDGSGNALRIGYNPGSNNFNIHDAAQHLFRNNGGTTEYGRFDSSGRLLVGTSSSRLSTNLEVEATSGSAGLSITRNSANTSPSVIYLSKTRATSVGGVTAVVDGDRLGSISFQGADGSTVVPAAEITAAVDGTPGANDMPGRLVFSTTADGASSPTERLRITSAGVLQVADAGNIAVGTTTGTKIGTATTQKLGFFNKTPVVQPAAVADATDAASVITQLNALLARMRDLGLIAT